MSVVLRSSCAVLYNDSWTRQLDFNVKMDYASFEV